MGTSVLFAYLAFAATFRGPQPRFWQRMTATATVLGTASLLARPRLRAIRPRRGDLALGAAIAAGLYVVFGVGDRVARVVMPHGAQDIGNIYRLRRLRSRGELAIRLAAVIAPAEELYWRGLLQEALTDRYGRPGGAALAAALYGGAHISTGNPTLVGAATIAGAGWSGLAAAGVPMPALIVSHALWDVWIFLIRPTQAVV
ncbi:MAG TPA: CPBP family intramembrane glutamic endopeptidase [Candidatus Dormibacteraeota bacterium]